MLNPWDALPLPSRPSLERYRKLAKQLLKAHQSDAVGEWAKRWIGWPAARPIERFAREKLAESGPKLTAAQDALEAGAKKILLANGTTPHALRDALAHRVPTTEVVR